MNINNMLENNTVCITCYCSRSTMEIRELYHKIEENGNIVDMTISNIPDSIYDLLMESGKIDEQQNDMSIILNSDIIIIYDIDEIENNPGKKYIEYAKQLHKKILYLKDDLLFEFVY